MLDQLRESIRSHGYVGDDRPAVLAYLSIQSALLNQPVSLLIKGPSGVGKSFALKTAQRYVPDEAYEEVSGMSERAIVYPPEDWDLRHRAFIIQEAAGWGGGDGRVFLRQLMTENRVSYLTVQSTGEGLRGERTTPVEGPCSVIMTTTNNALHPEDESRFLSCSIDYDADQVRAVLRAQSTGDVSEPTETELLPFHDAHRRLRDERPEVVIPFAARLGDILPVTHLRVMRDYPKVLSLIRTVALLHSCDRDRDANGAVIATMADYDSVRELVEECLRTGLGASTPDRIIGVVNAVSELLGPSSNEFDTVNQMEIARHLGIDRATVSRNVRSAVTEGYLEDIGRGQGHPSELRLGSIAVTEGSVLPSSEELMAAA